MTETKDLVIKIDSISVKYESKTVLENINWEVKKGQMAAIIGPNGGGKSTLLKSLVGIVHPFSGKILMFDKSPEKARPMVSYLPQTEEIDWQFPISVLDVVIQGRLVHKKVWQRSTKLDREKAYEALVSVGIEDLASKQIATLSGGQKQRTFLARAIAQEASLIILDEPATGLDALAQHELLELFIKLRNQGRTLVITTHDLNCLAENFDVVLALDQKVVMQGCPHEVLKSDILTRLFSKHFPTISSSGEVTIHEH